MPENTGEAYLRSCSNPTSPTSTRPSIDGRFALELAECCHDDATRARSDSLVLFQPAREHPIPGANSLLRDNRSHLHDLEARALDRFQCAQVVVIPARI